MHWNSQYHYDINSDLLELKSLHLLSQNIIHISSGRCYTSITSFARQWHQFIGRIGILHICIIGMIKHFSGFLPRNQEESWLNSHAYSDCIFLHYLKASLSLLDIFWVGMLSLWTIVVRTVSPNKRLDSKKQLDLSILLPCNAWNILKLKISLDQLIFLQQHYKFCCCNVGPFNFLRCFRTILI